MINRSKKRATRKKSLSEKTSTRKKSPSEKTPTRKKTPSDATEFEREQLRYFLSGDDLSATLAAINPSLAWLPWLSQMKLIQNETQLVGWLERNFAEADAVRDVVANLQFFGAETAMFLEHRLNAQAPALSPVLKKSWDLILRHMRNAKRSMTLNDWYEIEPQLKRGDHGDVLLERLANTLRPKVRLNKRFTLGEKDAGKRPEKASDLMSIEYVVQDGASSSEVLAAWPINAAATIDARLLDYLTRALADALADATDAGVEGNEGYGTSDGDVPSVAEHRQNEYRSGFLSIVRVVAEIWVRLAKKSPRIAADYAQRWFKSEFRLMRRIALFAAADGAVSPARAADMLINLPSGELFLTNSSVELHRLIRARWADFSPSKQDAILKRIVSGPPRSWFREGADVDRIADRCRFDLLADMKRARLRIGPAGTRLLNQIQKRFPEWTPKPPEQAGFHVWHESGPRDIGEQPDKLKGVSDSQLVAVAKKVAAKADFMDADRWQALCLGEPDRALRGLRSAAAKRNWPSNMWEQLLWSRSTYMDAGTEEQIARLLLKWPIKSFDKVSSAASSWLGEHAKTLSEKLLWPLWDKIADASLVEAEGVTDE
jgi:hypothetical protein